MHVRPQNNQGFAQNISPLAARNSVILLYDTARAINERKSRLRLHGSVHAANVVKCGNAMVDRTHIPIATHDYRVDVCKLEERRRRRRPTPYRVRAVVACNQNRCGTNAWNFWSVEQPVEVASGARMLETKVQLEGLAALDGIPPAKKIQGPTSGKVYFGKVLCSLRISTQPRKLAIKTVEAKWFDPLILITILCNCTTSEHHTRLTSHLHVPPA